MCGIRVVSSTLTVFISLTDTSLMIVTIKMHEKIRGGLPILVQT